MSKVAAHIYKPPLMPGFPIFQTVSINIPYQFSTSKDSGLHTKMRLSLPWNVYLKSESKDRKKCSSVIVELLVILCEVGGVFSVFGYGTVSIDIAWVLHWKVVHYFFFWWNFHMKILSHCVNLLCHLCIWLQPVVTFLSRLAHKKAISCPIASF